MDCIVHGVTKSWTRLSDFHFHSVWESTQENSLSNSEAGQRYTLRGKGVGIFSNEEERRQTLGRPHSQRSRGILGEEQLEAT